MTNSWSPAICENIDALRTLRTICVAPMMACTDRHDRYLLRLVTRHAVLYTEMVTTGALLFGDTEQLLQYDPFEHPVALQVAGSDPKEMARCARLIAEAGYDEININVGCPSDRVQSGHFGACLMAEPERVAECVGAMHAAVKIPITVKTRTGIDNRDSYEELCQFVTAVASAGCDAVIVHARKAWLSGLNPKQNREVPPLQYDTVHRLKQDFPSLEIIINGGIADLDKARDHLRNVDGVMIGRDAYHNPYLLAEVDRGFYSSTEEPLTRLQVLERYIEYAERQLRAGCRLRNVTRHVLGLFHGKPGARAWRRYLSEHMSRQDTGVEVLRQAAAFVDA
ncbi:MAG: tRNA dihydrouridine(20/20a) synthase DusA [Gammaproteobacteria bacterium]|nr:tRNA dihydrouridine(20/20a) synthase DusA [Gammaproteobacteria bacterium]